MAQRLKKLREERGLSHDRLSKALLDQFGVKISADSLINYEVSDQNHSKAGKNKGMRVEYLQCLADFYDVSADFLMGRSDVQSLDVSVKMISDSTGLSEKNAAVLCHAKRLYDACDNHFPEDDGWIMENFEKLNIPGIDDDCYNSKYSDFYKQWTSGINHFANDLLDAFTSSVPLMDTYSGMIEYVERIRQLGGITTSESFCDAAKTVQSSGLIMLGPCGYVRYISGEISKRIDSYFVKKYGALDKEEENE